MATRHWEELKWHGRKVGIFNGDTEEWRDHRKNDESLGGDLEREMGRIVGFGELREMLIGWGEDRKIMQKSQERRKMTLVRIYQQF